jgi:choline dehydrogenase-like flavoprotein
MVNFNYVIVGAVTADCVLASGLSEDPANRVLVLEYGGHDTNPRSTPPSCPSRSPATPRPPIMAVAWIAADLIREGS